MKAPATAASLLLFLLHASPDLLLPTESFAMCASRCQPKRSNTFTHHGGCVPVHRMIGGKNWENNSFLDGLSSGPDNDDDEMGDGERGGKAARAKEEYEEYRKSREAFVERQKKLMQTEAGQKFLKDRARDGDLPRGPGLDGFADPSGANMSGVGGDSFGLSEGGDALANKAGGSRFRQMMAQSKNAAVPRPGFAQFQQKLAIPLDDEEDEVNYEEGEEDGVTPKQ